MYNTSSSSGAFCRYNSQANLGASKSRNVRKNMQSTNESPFNERDWAFMSVQAPLGRMILARKLPVSNPTTTWLSRRFAPSNPRDLTVKRLRSRRAA
jgi:hypothetical protein